MKGPLFFTLLYFFTTAWAGGYQGCIERVWLYEAFVIDYELNPAASRTIGVQCQPKDWDGESKTCSSWKNLVGHPLSLHHYPHFHNGEHLKGRYSPQDAAMTFSTCTYGIWRGTKDARPTYDQFVFSLGHAQVRTGYTVLDSDGNLDQEQTAKKTYEQYFTPKPGQDPSKLKVYNFPAYRAVKETWEWNQLIKKVGAVVDAAYKANPDMPDDQKKMFERFDAATELVIKARTGDHGRHLIKAAEEELTGIDIKRENLGTNPVDGKAFETVDWAETIKGASDAGVSDPTTKVDDFLRRMYHGDGDDADVKSAREHWTVMQSYKQVKDEALACGRP